MRRRIGLVALGAAAALGAYFTLSLIPTDATMFNKDFGQEYLLARAIRDRVDPYQPIQVLAARYVQATGYLDKEHPTPHPPTVGLLALPLGFLSYSAAVRAWFFFELGCLVALVTLLTRAGSLPFRVRIAPVLALALVVWPPITLELGLGQLMLPLVLGLAAAQVALSARRPALGGGLLGLTLLIKPIGWPWLIVLAWRREWRALAAVAGVALVGGLLSLVALGFDSTMNYLVYVLPRMTTAYFAEPTNMSLWTVARRLGLTVPLAALPTVVLLVAIWIACKRDSIGDALGIMTVASLLTSPIMWYFYLTLAVLPLVQTVAAVKRRGLRAGDLVVTLGVLGLLSLSQDRLVDFARGGAGAGILMEPALGLGLLGILLAWLTARPWSEHRSNATRAVK